jgi:hypothetical protein
VAVRMPGATGQSLTDALAVRTRLGLDPKATDLELKALVALGIAEERDGRFGASKAAEQLAPDCLSAHCRGVVSGPISRTSSERGSATRRWTVRQRNDRPPTAS